METLSTSKGATRLCVLFFLQACALGLWSVNMSNVLKANGLEHIISYVFACNSIAALLSPLAVGALSDHHLGPERVLRILGLGAALFLGLLFFAIQQHWGAVVVLILTQIHALWSVPTFGLTTSLVLSRLNKPQQQFGPVRLWATVGWMTAGVLISWVLMADTSVVSGYAACVAWLLTVAFSFTISPTPLSENKVKRNWKQKLGLDALVLLRDPDHKVVFITAALLNMVLAAFYPFTVLHLEDLGVTRTTAVMSTGQITEMIAMIGLSSVLGKIRLKWVFLTGIAFGVLRYGLFIFDNQPAMFLGVFIHGFCFTLFVITAQIYLEQRVPASMRARAQALLTLMMNGVGNLAGYLFSGWWRQYCQTDGRTEWPVFWAGMTLVTVAVFIFFAVAYKGKSSSDPSAETY